MKYLALAVLAIIAASTPASAATVHVLDVKGMIEPVVAQYVEQGIERAQNRGAKALVIQLDTPGGGMEPMREIVQDMLNARIPIIVWVGPNGARAGSAGTFITLAANVAAMAPVTNIGSAHPVFAGPLAPSSEDSQGQDNILMEKVVNDSVAYIASIAEKRGRNAKWAEDAVRKSVNVKADEAVKLNVVDFMASDMQEVLARADGMKVQTASGTVILATKGASVERYPMKWHLMLLHYLANPLVAYFLMLIAIYGIIFEISTPGATIPGVVGGIAAILLLYSFSVIPLNVAGLILVLVAIGFFIAEIKVQSHGVLTAGGVIAFFLGSLMVFGSGLPGASVPISAIIAGTLATAGFFAFLIGWGAHALKNPVITGREALLGLVVEARTDIDPTGKIFAEGAWWTAITDGAPVRKGESVRIIAVEGLKVKVVKEDISDTAKE